MKNEPKENQSAEYYEEYLKENQELQNSLRLELAALRQELRVKQLATETVNKFILV